MTTDQDQPSDLALSFDARIPLSIVPIEEEPDASQLARLNESNETVMRTLFALEEFFPDNIEENTGLGQEIARLDFKMNLILDLVSGLVNQFVKLPAEQSMRLAATALEWKTSVPPASGEVVRAELYLHPQYPRPLVLIGSIEPAGDTEPGVSRIRFHKTSESVQDWLEKFIFRHHRRSIAQSRS